MGAEAPVAHADRILGAEHRRHQRMMHPIDGEGAHTQPVDVRAVPESQPVELRELVDLPVENMRRQSLLVRADVGHAGIAEHGARDPSAMAPTTFGLPAS